VERAGQDPRRVSLWIDEWRRRLDDVLDHSLEAYAAACLGIGGTELAGAERAARRLVARAPLRESGYRLLMDTLAAQGNVGEAMRVYGTARTTLREELGLAPGPAIQEAHARCSTGPRQRAESAGHPRSPKNRSEAVPLRFSDRFSGASLLAPRVSPICGSALPGRRRTHRSRRRTLGR
jgi:DNA-binding SARP family transcriptional activator